MKYLKNPETGKIISGEAFGVYFDDWIEPTSAELTQLKREQLKAALKNSRQIYLNQTFQPAFEAMEEGIEYEDKTKRQQAKQELKEIKNATTLTALNKFNPVFE